ncbi:hypothetical protein Stsp01_12370 [Streptomyces sp. NBRC 13847]|nr:hypothetical protein Stsp01_12370 [Streptomyces sp. NBRC 13847]
MIRIHFTAADFARVRFAPRPAPLQELNAALMTMTRPDDEVLFGRWRHRLLRSLPGAVLPLRDLVPGEVAPLFLDVFSDTLAEGWEAIRDTRPELVRSELRRAYAGQPAPAPAWIRALHGGEAGAWEPLLRAQHAAFETALRPVWPLVQDLHRAEFTRHALTVAEHGVGAALTALVPGSQLRSDVWELVAPVAQDFVLSGRGVLLMPTFHWTGHPLLSDLPGRPLTVTFPAGPGLPLPAGGGRRGPGARRGARTDPCPDAASACRGAHHRWARPAPGRQRRHRIRPCRRTARGGPGHHGPRGTIRTAPAHRAGEPAGAAARVSAAGRQETDALRGES